MSVEHPDCRQTIYCPRGSLSGCGVGNDKHRITLHARFAVRLVQWCSITAVAPVKFMLQSQFLKGSNLSAQVGVCACDQPVVKSHFSGTFHFIIQMTSSKIRSPSNPGNPRCELDPGLPHRQTPGSHYHWPLPSEEATGQDVLMHAGKSATNYSIFLL